jgi:hypothetical protein
MRAIWTLLAVAIALAATAVAAHAFCGFYVAGSNQRMFNDATQVVLMRDGTRTVLTMQNDYRGPLEDFAMVVPVPVVLKPTDVKVVDKAVLGRLDSLGSPRLVEYWEQDPCPAPVVAKHVRAVPEPVAPASPAPAMSLSPREAAGDSGLPAEPMAVAPVLAAFAADPPALTAGVATPITWSFSYANDPYPEPRCTIDHGVGRVTSGATRSLTLRETTTVTLVCGNAAGRSTKQFRISVVKIEAEFEVAEYQIKILSATEAAGLEQWLRLNGYKIPDDAEPLLRPYIDSGSKFFVAKVDPKKVKMLDGRLALSPLRFHYDSEDFSLPIRLGLANSSGKQDLIVNILSADRRYEVANYKNVFIPTNFDVKPAVKTRFAEFYAALLDRTLETHPGAVVTEYAWTAVPNYHCDPCTDADISNPDVLALGGDIVGGQLAMGTFVLTRLHARYGKSDMTDDLRFREARPVTGGREQWTAQGLESGAQPSPQNYFQARYAIRHEWTGPISCPNPVRGVWGGPPDGNRQPPIAAGRIAFAPRGQLELAAVVNRDLWELGYTWSPSPPTRSSAAPARDRGWLGELGFGALVLLALGVLIARRMRA